MKGILTNCFTEKKTEVELSYEITQRKTGEKEFVLIGGPTGYESFLIGTSPGCANLERMCTYGWLACAGTPHRWNKLSITGEEMKKVLEKEGVIRYGSVR